MTKTNEAKAVREARAEARRMAKKTELTYQQALDRIARDAGHDHWAAFAASHPATKVDRTSPEIEDIVTTRAKDAVTGRDTVSSYIRTVISGEHGAAEERIRSTLIFDEAEEFAIELPVNEEGFIEIDEDRVRRNLWWSAVRNMAFPTLMAVMIGTLYSLNDLIMPGTTGFGMADVVRVTAYAAAIPVTVFLACLAIGDQPGMERRRAVAWSVMLWMQIVGVVMLFLNGFGAFDALLERVTGINSTAAYVIGFSALAVGRPLRKSLHALMALGAALGPKGDGSSFADRDAISSAMEEEREERRRSAPPHVEMTPEMARELGEGKKRRLGPIEILIGVIVIGCALSFIGVALQFGLGINATPVAQTALLFLTPVAVLAMLGMAAYTIWGALEMPRRWRERMRHHRLVREHEAARKA